MACRIEVDCEVVEPVIRMLPAIACHRDMLLGMALAHIETGECIARAVLPDAHNPDAVRDKAANLTGSQVLRREVAQISTDELRPVRLDTGDRHLRVVIDSYNRRAKTSHQNQPLCL